MKGLKLIIPVTIMQGRIILGQLLSLILFGIGEVVASSWVMIRPKYNIPASAPSLAYMPITDAWVKSPNPVDMLPAVLPTVLYAVGYSSSV
jgi:hypothetical protein